MYGIHDQQQPHFEQCGKGKNQVKIRTWVTDYFFVSKSFSSAANA